MGKRIECPLLGTIEDGICFDIHMVVDGMAPERTIPLKAYEVTNFKEICRKCKNHRDD